MNARLSASLVAISVVLMHAGPAMAQATTDAPATEQANNANMDGEILVTARKRDETLISVPVVVSAVGSVELERRAINSMDGIARIVPQLIIAPQGGSIQGGNIAIRGVSGPDSNPFGDQAVSFNIDGVQIAKATVRRMSDTDIAQIEVLKGPQALFYGKNSPAGIISIRTADPGNHLEAGGNVGYEFNAREFRTEAFISSPLTDTLGVRVAGTYSTMDGYLRDITPRNLPGYTPAHDRSPNGDTFAVRGTVKFNPSDVFDAKLKVNYGETDQNGAAGTTQLIYCAGAAPQTGSASTCRPGDRTVNAGYGSFVSTIPATQNYFRADGQNYLKQKQSLIGFEMNFHPTDEITLTSVTGYYSVALVGCQNYNNDYEFILPSCNRYKNKEFSQELRASTDYDGPLNFTAGVYYSHTSASTGSMTYGFGRTTDLFGPGVGGPTTPLILNNYFLKMKGTAYSAFLQMSYKPIDVIEIDIGGRYSHEKKRLPLVQDAVSTAAVTGSDKFLTPATTLNLVKSEGSWNDFSPEITASYRPSRNLTLFGSYKHGFLSGGFNSSSSSFADPVPSTPQNEIDISYNPQTIKGFEGGVKAALLDNKLRVNLSVYTYKIKDLQVTNFSGTISTIRNAGAVSVKGIEGDFAYSTPLQGLSLRGGFAFNKGKYTSFPAAPCYAGQTAAQGCVGGIQNLGGTELVRAPKWNLNGGFNYETGLGYGLKMGLSADANYTTSFLTDATSAPLGRQPAYTLIDATLRLGAENDSWQLALIGRNLADKYYFVASTDVPLSVTIPGGGDRYASVSRGREIMIRASFKFGR